jgi:hypothetical protein
MFARFAKRNSNEERDTVDRETTVPSPVRERARLQERKGIQDGKVEFLNEHTRFVKPLKSALNRSKLVKGAALPATCMGIIRCHTPLILS